MTHTSTEQERDLKDIEQALRLVREAHQHEVDAYRPELYKPECDRRPKPQLDRLGDLICLLQNILYAAQQASRRAQVVPQGWRLVPEWPTVEMSVAGDDVYREDGPDVFSSNTIYTRMLAAAPQPPEAGCSVSNGETQAVLVELPEPDAWRYTDARGHYRYRGARPGFAVEYPILKPDALYTAQQVRELLEAHGTQEQST